MNKIEDKQIMNTINTPKKRIFTDLGYEEEDVAALTEGLNKLLASYSVHYQKLRNFHWNVKGPDFFDIHEKFEDQYNQSKLYIDSIAERIRVFGKTPLSTMRSYLDHSAIKESPTDLNAMNMVKEIIADYRILMSQMYDVIDLCIDHGDSGTEEMIKDMIKQVEEFHWMMSAFSANEN